jgi:hypothetical protein
VKEAKIGRENACNATARVVGRDESGIIGPANALGATRSRAERHTMSTSLRTLLLLLVALWAPFAAAQTPCPVLPAPAAAELLESPLPPPTGLYSVGRTSYLVPGPPTVTAEERPTGDLMVYVWYPAEVTNVRRPAPYLVGWTRARQAIEASVRRLFQDAYCAFEQSRVFSHAVEDAPITKAAQRYPLLIFAHGLGITSFAYAAQLEELASHGYVVAAVEYTPAAPFVVFPDGRVERFQTERFNLLTGKPEGLQYEKLQIEGGARAIIAALNGMAKQGRAGRIAGRIDLTKVGVFGHSLGGMSALRAVQLDQRIRAGVMQDGISPGLISFAADDGRRSTARIGVFLRPIPASQTNNVSQLLASLPPGTLLATPSSPGFSHMSFSDLLLLRAGPSTGARAAPLRNLALARAFTRSFFDQALRGAPSGPTALPLQGYPELKIETAADRPVTASTPSATARPATTRRPARTS